ncbi:MAG: hypothetical protein ACLFVT_02575 [Syntrophobacteria bacterium]
MKHSGPLNPERVIDILLGLAPHTRLCRHTPGQITLQLMVTGRDAFDGADLDELLQGIPGIRTAKIRLLSRSVVITYDQERVPSDLWESWLQLREEPHRALEVRARLESILYSDPGG